MASGHHAAPPSDGPVVVSTSVKNPKQRSVLVARPTNDDASFLSATLTGLNKMAMVKKMNELRAINP